MSLKRQLEAALTEARRVSEQARDKSSAKVRIALSFVASFKLLSLSITPELQDRAMQTRILDLESQLSQSRAEIARVKREKEEVGG